MSNLRAVGAAAVVWLQVTTKWNPDASVKEAEKNDQFSGKDAAPEDEKAKRVLLIKSMRWKKLMKQEKKMEDLIHPNF